MELGVDFCVCTLNLFRDSSFRVSVLRSLIFGCNFGCIGSVILFGSHILYVDSFFSGGIMIYKHGKKVNTPGFVSSHLFVISHICLKPQF